MLTQVSDVVYALIIVALWRTKTNRSYVNKTRKQQTAGEICHTPYGYKPFPEGEMKEHVNRTKTKYRYYDLQL